MKTKLVTTDIDKETGKVSSDVIYLPDFESLFKSLLHAREDIEDISTGKGMSDEIKSMLSKDPKLKEFRDKIEKLFLEYRLHIRKNYPDEYKEIQKIAEESTTGGTAGSTEGTGEQYSTPFAFNKNKKANGSASTYYYKLGYKLAK